MLPSNWTRVPNKVAGDCIYILYSYIGPYIYIYKYICICVCVCVCVYIYIYIYIYTVYIYIYIYILCIYYLILLYVHSVVICSCYSIPVCFYLDGMYGVLLLFSELDICGHCDLHCIEKSCMNILVFHTVQSFASELFLQYSWAKQIYNVPLYFSAHSRLNHSIWSKSVV